MIKFFIVNKIFFKYMINYFVERKVFENVSHGATQRNLASIKVLKEIPFPLPPLPEQIKITNLLEILNNKQKSDQKNVHEIEILFSSLLKELMNGNLRILKIKGFNPYWMQLLISFPALWIFHR